LTGAVPERSGHEASVASRRNAPIGGTGEAVAQAPREPAREHGMHVPAAVDDPVDDDLAAEDARDHPVGLECPMQSNRTPAPQRRRAEFAIV
jgi:hypothetical protein